jgi:hypothetical protein
LSPIVDYTSPRLIHPTDAHIRRHPWTLPCIALWKGDPLDPTPIDCTNLELPTPICRKPTSGALRSTFRCGTRLGDPEQISCWRSGIYP